MRTQPVSGTSALASRFLQFPECLSTIPREEERCEGSTGFILLHQGVPEVINDHRAGIHLLRSSARAATDYYLLLLKDSSITCQK